MTANRQGGGRNILRCRFHLDVGGADLLEAIAHRPQGKLRPVAVAAQVPEINLPQISGYDLLRDCGGGLVAEMSMAAENALFDAPRPAAILLEQLQVVIGLEHQDIGSANPFHGQLGGVTEIGEEAQVAGTGADQESNRVLGIVRDGKGVDGKVADLETGAR